MTVAPMSFPSGVHSTVSFKVEGLLAASTAAASDDIFSESRTILNSAASSGGTYVFEAVLSELETHWSGWQVRVCKCM